MLQFYQCTYKLLCNVVKPTALASSVQLQVELSGNYHRIVPEMFGKSNIAEHVILEAL
jgi:hypothetical protein